MAHDIALLREMFGQALKQPMKERRKLGRTIGHVAMGLEKSGALTNADDMQVAIRALAFGASSHSYPQRYQMSRARLMRDRRQLLGLDDPEVAFEQAKTLPVDAGCLTISDVALAPETRFSTDGPFHETLNTHGFFAVGLGGDGSIKTRLRIHKSGPCEPQSSEFRKLKEATSEARLELASGEVLIDGGAAKVIQAPIKPGSYCVSAFGLGIGRNPQCLVLVSPIEDAPPLPLQEMPELQF